MARDDELEMLGYYSLKDYAAPTPAPESSAAADDPDREGVVGGRAPGVGFAPGSEHLRRVDVFLEGAQRWQTGRFHKWGFETAAPEADSRDTRPKAPAIRQFTAAVVELPGGQVVMVHPSNLRFIKG